VNATYNLHDGNAGNLVGALGQDGHPYQCSGSKNIFRFNLAVHDTFNTVFPRDEVVAFYSIHGEVACENHAYNETYVGPTAGQLKAIIQMSSQEDSVVGNTFTNCIFYRPRNYYIIWDNDIRRALSRFSNVYDGNLLYRADSPAWIRYSHLGGQSYYSLDEAKSALPTLWGPRNIAGQPRFVDEAHGDYRLSVESPAIDAGIHLTVATVGGGNATALPVRDAGYFTDGWGIIEPDSIRIDGAVPSETVGIAAIDYVTHTITLASSRSWSPGARIWYYRTDRFRGSAPDIGALEYAGGAISPPPPAIPAQPALLSPASGDTGVAAYASLQWTPVTSASSYVLEVADSPLFTSLFVRADALSSASYTLSGLAPGHTYYWRVAAVNDAGTGAWSTVSSFTTHAQVPRDWALEQNFPNPFNPTTTIVYRLPTPARVRLALYDAVGRLVLRLIDADQEPGEYAVSVGKGNLASGVYFYALQAGTFFDFRRMVLLK
jgi:hypothetical protein